MHLGCCLNGEHLREILAETVSTDSFDTEYLHNIGNVAVLLQNLRNFGVLGDLHDIETTDDEALTAHNGFELKSSGRPDLNRRPLVPRPIRHFRHARLVAR